VSLDVNRQGPSSLQRASDSAVQEPPVPAPTVAAPDETPAEQFPEIDPSTVGVVFVHGIGQQVRAEIVLDWSAPIVAAVAEWAASRPDTNGPDAGYRWNPDRVVRSEVNFEGTDLPLVTLRVPGTVEDRTTYTPQTWVMTEARWAQQVRPPSLETMIDWCGPRGVVATVVERIIAHTMQGRGVTMKALAAMGLSTFISVMVSIVLLGYAMLQTVAGIIPYKPLQDAIARLQLDTFLTTWWGDVYVLLDDPVQAANIRGQVNRAIRGLRRYGCHRIVVIAHSGGTIVSYMALSDPAATETADTLVTHGEAIEMGRYIHSTEGSGSTSPGSQIDLGRHLRDVTRWHDYYGTHDPAPSGRLDEATVPGHPEFLDTEVWNRMSIADDHGTYFSNDEEFVNGVLKDIETAGSPAASSRFEAGDAARIFRRHQRVYILALWERLMFVLPLLAVTGAFLASGGLLEGLWYAAYRAVTAIPGVNPIADAIHAVKAPPVNGFPVSAAASLLALFAMFAIVQAVLPIGRNELWTGWRSIVFRFLDRALFVSAVVLAWIVRAFQSHDPLGATLDLGKRVLTDPVLIAAGVAFAAILWVLRAPASRDMVKASRQSHPTLTGSIFLAVAALIFVVVGYGVIVDRNIREIVVGTIVALVLFQVLGKIGAWRWRVWDENERRVARRRSAPYKRRWIWVQFLLLGAIAVAVAAAITTGVVAILVGAALALGAFLVAAIGADVVGHEAT